MLSTYESLASLPPADSGHRPLTKLVIATCVTLMVVIAAAYFFAFPVEYRHPIDVIDAVREGANFLGVAAVAVWVRRDIKVLNIGFAFFLLSLWMEVVDEFTAEPHWIGTIIPAILGIAGIAMVAIGVREAARRRKIEAERRNLAEEALRQSVTTLSAVVESTPDAIWVKGADGRFMLANTAFAALVGRPQNEIVGRAEAELFAERPDAPGRAIARALESGVAERFEATVAVAAGGASSTFLVSRSVFKDAAGSAVGVLGIARDISDRKAVEDRLFKQAHHDALTGLANRAAFIDHLSRAIGRWKHRPERLFAVLFLDIDRFKDVNDKYGHAVGDEALVAFAEALAHWLRPEDFIARLGGDEFTVILHEVGSRGDAEIVAERIIDGLQKPLALSTGPVGITASVGVALSSAATDTAESMLRAADAAMYRAKEMGRGRQVTAGV